MPQQILTGNVLQDGITYHAADINAAVNNATLLVGAITGQGPTVPADSQTMLLSNGSALKYTTLLQLKNYANTNVSTTGVANIGDGVAFSGGLTLNVSGTQNDYAPAGFDTATWLQLTATSPTTITGMVAPSVIGTLKVISCASGTISLMANDTGSASANRLVLGNSVASLVLASDNTATFLYFNSRWRLICST